MELEYEREEKDYPSLDPKYYTGVPGCNFSFEKGFITTAEDIEYKEIEIHFRRDFPFAYPGYNGERNMCHKWKIRSGNTYYTYKVCRICFDIRIETTEHPCEKYVQTCVCAPCRVNPFKSRNYWDAIYTTLCSCPLLGDRFEHCIKWKMSRLGYDCTMLKVGSVPCRTEIPEEIRDSSKTEPSTGNNESDSESYDL